MSRSPSLFTKQVTAKLSLGLCLAVTLGLGLASRPLAVQAADPVNVTGSRTVDLTLQGSNIADYLVAETPDFLNAVWTAFDPNQPSVLGPDNEVIEVMTVPFTVTEGDGEKIIYIKYRNTAQEESEVMTVTVTLSAANSCLLDGAQPLVLTGCEGLPMEPISNADRAKYRMGVSPRSGEYVPASFIFSGDFIRSENSTTVYCVSSDYTLRPFMDETSYFTQSLAFQPVKWVRDETLATFIQDDPMLPAQNVALVKFPADAKVYHFVQDPQDPTHGLLHWVATADLAVFIAGEDWADYVIDLNPTLAPSFDIGDPYLTMDDVIAAKIELENFRARDLLNENSASVEDAGVDSSLSEQMRAALRAAGDFIRQGLNKLNPFKKE